MATSKEMANSLCLGDSSLLDFVNRVGATLGLIALPWIWLADTEPDDEINCIVARALGLPVGESVHAEWKSQSRWVMRMPDGATARRIAVTTNLDWKAQPAFSLDFRSSGGGLI